MDIKNQHDNINKLLNQLISLYKKHKDLLCEKYIKGRELTVAVIEKNNSGAEIKISLPI